MICNVCAFYKWNNAGCLCNNSIFLLLSCVFFIAQKDSKTAYVYATYHSKNNHTVFDSFHAKIILGFTRVKFALCKSWNLIPISQLHIKTSNDKLPTNSNKCSFGCCHGYRTLTISTWCCTYSCSHWPEAASNSNFCSMRNIETVNPYVSLELKWRINATNLFFLHIWKFISR